MIFAGSTIALKGANQEIFFIGKDSHGFNDNGTASGSGGSRTNNTASKLGDSTGSTLTFINAVFTGSNALVSNDSSKQRIKGDSTTDVEDLKDGNFYASDVHIGQAGERTTYHILFDYTDALGNKAKKGFGKYHTYLGNINGLESDSIIKFKNAGYINEEQIKGTKATILLDNTQLKGDFRADVAVLDFRDNSPAISGNILTSDTKSSGAVLSRKLLTFDLIKAALSKLLQMMQDSQESRMQKLKLMDLELLLVVIAVITNKPTSSLALSLPLRAQTSQQMNLIKPSNLSDMKGDLALKNAFNFTNSANFSKDSSSHLQIVDKLKAKLGGNQWFILTE